MATEIIRVGIVGAGGNTKLHHIPKLQAIEGVEVVSVVNRSRESSQRVADEFGIPTVYDSWQELINADDTNAIVIGTWPYMHCRLTLAALAANKHVMCEARMAMNASEAHQMRNASREKPHLISQIVPSPFSFGVDATIQRLIGEGYLGNLLAIAARSNANAFLNQDGPLLWRHDFDLSGLNIMFMGIWYEAMMRWVGGAKRVTAMGKTFVTMRKNADGHMRPVRIPEHLDIIGEMDCGAQLHMQCSTVTGLAGTTNAYLYGDQGTLFVDATNAQDNKLYGGRRGDDELKEIEIPESERGSWRVEEEFVAAIRGEEEITRTSFEDGVKYMEFTEAVNRSMAEGRTVALPL
ncbi:MAG: Gfo/Idh/MocA family oxidoreductase [Chloroflexota bacterium]